ncbi:cobalamin B12-binding domain-containing protein [Methanolobus bombayensis]|uniref:cobalamin B12-binding domain-containing protein n=1 Tax=Methanolobus bombayensis TaxID=38023 RepID=UPI001AE64010|nr:cobalamin-dependent protein [Methanolobus bombayensis]MBP1908593.1 methylmalonyl-CoA mutase cobalamin-binding domain/chain [Methanolobus bombayensis]
MPAKEELLVEAYESFVEIDEKKVFNVIEKWIDSGYEIKDLLEKFAEALTEIGRRFEEKEYFLAQLVNSTLIFDKAYKLIAENMAEKAIEMKGKGTIVMATVRNDTHDLGKNIAASMLRIAGFNVIDIGKDKAASEIIDAAVDNEADIIAVSSMTSTTMRNLEELIGLLEEKEIRQNIKVIVSGALVTQEYADSIGADACARTATEAVEIAETFVS